MYPASFAVTVPDRTALVVAGRGDAVTYAALDDRSARLAGLLHAAGLRPGDTLLIACGNDVRWGEVFWAARRSGLHLAAVNRHLSAAELVPMTEDARPAAVVAGGAGIAKALDDALARAGVPVPAVRLVIGPDVPSGWTGHDAAVAAAPRLPRDAETTGGRILWSSGTTGRPKPFRVAPTGGHPADGPVRSAALMRSLGFRTEPTGPGEAPDVLLVAGPAYHAGPLGFLQSVQEVGGTVVLMERFEPEAALAAIERYRVTHSQWVPTMFVRLLRLPDEVRNRYDLSSHRVAVHGAAPCPPETKRAVLDWWGPIVHEYYGSSEGYGRTTIGPHEWRERPGSVGRPAGSTVHVADADGRPLGPGEVGAVWFARPGAAEPQRRPDGAADLAATPGWGTAGDLGHVDADGYLYLDGRSGHTIITGGVNVYPREVEDVLLPHPEVADAAVVGLPDPEFGERVVAVVVPAADADRTGLADRLVAHCRARLAGFKTPREVRLVESLPRSDAGKVRMGELRASLVPEPAGSRPWS
ncbi:O-succinylbenzoic acid--CoA ligase [Pseudonocardia sp. Ae406_Ps2]|uniref:AMP-binding protein n=1 Tax=unclassified Pseudonocardia TaxID=2619320 RepID=UPI00094B5D73|nr:MULTISPECIES: AMP-binding protein [unclassified Pseudonocardia]OLL98030.1 O-succinylbenzoic acid--CoA ligase [Pseudonocardia sp. Ae331_Ps2]OLM04261.1 O-succinylbenzoic acid--CoA ligase [Pseudonocardia sp. Ae406_Ps2]OLM10904.1 O-succinylbenzoic acid--CoA ligase [Pseudonocardia sp. Ae505_Ps2]OLM25822.1 O-succinylbenzoic acid--CoA ligase [Pseudonocardia sp. Ae706_Ps2]OLM34042.1 O-succinylbenzoic acid--CoA ligase [Pseudonocardia sp. Ae717_Ps2]